MRSALTDLPVPEDDGAAAHLPGTKVPQLELSDTRLTVLYIYPLTGIAAGAEGGFGLSSRSLAQEGLTDVRDE